MKKTLISLCALLSIGSASRTHAQCTPVVTPGTMILCPNSSDTLWSDAHDTYQWLQDGNIIAGANQQYFVVDVNTYGFSEISVVTTTTGCPNATDTSNEVFIDGYVFLLPFVTNITNSYICDNQDSVIFDFSYDSTVQWYFNGAPIPGANNDTFVAYAPGFYTVEGAPDECPSFVMPLGLDLEVTATPTPVMFTDSQAICDGTPAFVGVDPGDYNSYQWYINGNLIINSNTPYFFATTDGYYHVEATDGNCTLVSDSTYVWEHTPVTPVIIVVNNTLVSVPGGSQLSNFQWYLNGNPIPMASDSTFIPTINGDYFVTAWDGYCEDTSAVYQYTLSVRDVKADISFQLYPNPAQNDVTINSAEAVSVQLLDNLGRIVYSSAETNRKHHLALSHLAKGVYIVKLTGEKGSAYERVVLE